MTIARSTGLVNFVASKGSVRQALNNCRVLLLAGTAPTMNGTNADAGYSGLGGTLLATLTSGGAAFSPEVVAKWRFTLTGSAGSVSSIKVGGTELLAAPVNYSTSIAVTAGNIVNAINNNSSFPDFTAQLTGGGSDEVQILAPIDSGVELNAYGLAVTASGGLTATVYDAGDPEILGVASVAGGRWQYVPSTGVISKEAAAWQGLVTGAGTQTVTWFMIVTDNDNGQTLNTDARRIIGTVSTSGADLNLSGTSLSNGATVTVNSWTLTVSR